MKREQSFLSKFDKGEVENLAVEISEYYSYDNESSNSGLLVKPVETTPESEIEIRSIEPKSALTVKPIDDVIRRIPASSYEQIYETVSVEDVSAHNKMTPAEILMSLGDQFQGTQDIPESFSSFEELYQRTAEDTDDATKLSPLKAATELPGERWSAPAGAIEPPILEENEFSSRFDPLKYKIESHWEDIENLMSTETLTGQEPGQDSSKKPSSS